MVMNTDANRTSRSGGHMVAERMRHAAAHLAEGERPETVAMWFELPLEAVCSLLGSVSMEAVDMETPCCSRGVA